MNREFPRLACGGLRQVSHTSAIDRSSCNARSNAAGIPQHGTATAYRNFYCRCPDGREDNRLNDKRRREGRQRPPYIDSRGTARRLQALACLGYTMNALAPWFAARPELVGPASVRGGMSASRINQLRRPARAKIWVPQAKLIAAAYDALSMTPAPPTVEGDRLRRYAARIGWAPPMAWDNIDDALEKPKHLSVDHPDMIDELELERLLAGSLPPEPTRRRARLNDAAVQILDEKGLSAPQIAARLKISERCVVRVRARIGISHVAPPTQAELNPGIARANRRNTNQAEAPHSTAHERHHEAA